MPADARPFWPRRSSGGAESETIGHSTAGRPLHVHYRGRHDSVLRIFVLAGQHGDEADARAAAAEYAAQLKSSIRSLARIAILPDANPDGAAAATRHTAAAADLNRDHLLLTTSEALAIHRYVERWRPHLIIDVHTYRPWSPILLEHGFVFPQDVMIDVPTNPAARACWPAEAAGSLIGFVKRRMRQGGLRCERYTLLRSGIVRHSSLDIVDTRNGLAVRYGIPAVLLEGRRAFRDDYRAFAPPAGALVRSIQAVVEWAETHPHVLLTGTPLLSAGEKVPVRCQYAPALLTARYMELQSVTTGRIQRTAVPGRYLPSVRTTRRIPAPRAYAVLNSCVKLLDILARQRFATTRIDQLGTTERVHVDDSHTIFPTAQAGGRMLMLLLDPESQFGAHRYKELDVPAHTGPRGPVVRLM